MRYPLPARRLLPLLVLLALGPTPGAAYVDITIDQATIAEVLGAMSARQVQVAIPGGRKIAVSITDLRVTGLTPSDGVRRGFINTAMTLRAPEIGMTLPIEPQVTLDVIEHEQQRLVRMKFHNVNLKLPLLGSIDISGFMPPIYFPAEYVAPTRGPQGAVEIVSRLVDVQTGSQVVRLRFDVKATTPGAPATTATGGRP